MPYERSKLAILRYFSGLHLCYLMENEGKEQFPDIFQPEKQDIAWILVEYPALLAQLNKYESGEEEPLQSPRIVANKKQISCHAGAFYQNDHPVFLIGTQDMFSLNSEVGFSVTGGTFSPAWEFPSESNRLHSTDSGHLKSAKGAAAAGQFWDELYSVHICPKWLVRRFPQLHVGVGFVGHDITHPIVQTLDRRTFERVLPELAKAENFLFLDLANEPAFNGVTENSVQEFRAFLKEDHGTLENVNKVWGSSFRSFEEINVPAFVNRGWCAYNRQARPKTPVEQRQYIDWSNYNCKRVNDFFMRLTAWCHELAPQTLTYTKMVSNYWPALGIDPIMNVRTTDISGSDAWWVYQGVTGPSGSSDAVSGAEKVKRGYAVGWQRSLMHYDMLRSARPDVPIVNAEDHQFADGFTPLSEKHPEVPSGHWDMPIPANHFFSGQWQQALHGKGMSLIWMHWPRHNVRDRAVAIWGNSKAALDLNRLGHEVNAFQRTPPKVRILISRNTQLWSFSFNSNYWKKVTEVYEALSLNGVHIGFLFEEDLMAGKMANCELVIAPYTDRIDREALETLKKSGIRIATIGAESLKADRYNRPHPVKTLPELFQQIKEAEFSRNPQEIMRKLLKESYTGPEFMVLVDGSPAKRIEWRSAEFDGRKLLNLCNYGQIPVTVEVPGLPEEVIDLIEMRSIKSNSFPMESQQVRLLTW